VSRLDPLVDALKKTEAEDVRLVVGERIFITMRGGRRVEIGREPLQASSVQALAAEVLSPEDLAAAQRMPRIARVDRGGETIEVQVTPQNGQISLVVRRASGAEAAAPPPPEDSASALLPPTPEPMQKSTTQRSLRRSGNAIDALLDDMMSRQASDLHLTTGSCPVMRVHGEMHFVRERPVLTSDAVMALIEPLFTEKARNDFEEKHDADFAYEVPGLARFRVNAFMDRMGAGAVMRQIPIDIIPAEKLGLPQAVLDLCFLTKGLVVVTGPTGSGKSTTLAGMVDYINKNRSDHIITIEDPVEFVHKNIKCLVNQREVGQHTMSFKNALRAALREDPDIVLVGEMRDLETIAIAIETAETGHLVFGTLHTTTAISTVDRIIDQFPTDQQEQIRVMLSESLKGVIAQVLCKKTGGGRVAAMEILLGSPAVASLIREGKTFQIPSVMQTSRGAGMVTMNDSLMQLVQKKLVDPKEAWMKSVDKGGLLMMFKNAGIPAPVV
jgi:twitching motility protein PilT